MEWLIEDFLPEASVTLLTGESGCGKSTFALALSGAVCHGRNFLGRKTKQRPVIIVDGENGLAVVQARLKRLHIEQTPLLHIWGGWSEPYPTGPREPDLLKVASEHKPLVIFDSLIEFHPGSEQDASETRRYMHAFRRLSAAGATVLLIHHTGKSEGSRDYRGSSDIKASVDNAYLLTSKGSPLESIAVKPFKSREGLVTPIDAVMRDGHFELRDDYDEDVIREILRVTPGINQGEIVAKAKTVTPQMSEHKIRAILETGKHKGRFHVTLGPKNAQLYSIQQTDERV